MHVTNRDLCWSSNSCVCGRGASGLVELDLQRAETMLMYTLLCPGIERSRMHSCWIKSCDVNSGYTGWVLIVDIKLHKARKAEVVKSFPFPCSLVTLLTHTFSTWPINVGLFKYRTLLALASLEIARGNISTPRESKISVL